MTKELKLHLGCGDKRIEGYINIDVRYLPTVDKVDNIRFLRTYKENSVNTIYCSHVLEHFGRWEYITVLRRWHEILEPNGILRVCVPDFGSICEHYIKNREINKVRGMLYGGQDYAENHHYWCWDFDALKTDLESVGFNSVKKFDWRDTDHSHIDDCSQAYLPHMDKDNGQLMSLNVEAVK